MASRRSRGAQGRRSRGARGGRRPLHARLHARSIAHSCPCQPSTPVLAARAARREKLSEACHENRAFHCDLPSESAVFAMHAAVQTPKVVRQPAHHCELGLRPRGAQQRRLRGQNVPTPVRSAVFRSRSSGGRCEGFEPVGPPCAWLACAQCPPSAAC